MDVYLLLQSMRHIKRFSEKIHHHQLANSALFTINELEIIINKDCKAVNVIE